MNQTHIINNWLWLGRYRWRGRHPRVRTPGAGFDQDGYKILCFTNVRSRFAELHTDCRCRETADPVHLTHCVVDKTGGLKLCGVILPQQAFTFLRRAFLSDASQKLALYCFSAPVSERYKFPYSGFHMRQHIGLALRFHFVICASLWLYRRYQAL